MTIKLYLISPRSGHYNDFAFASRGEGKGFGLTRLGALGLLTVAAMVPADFSLRLCDEELEPIDFETDADVIALCANVAQAPRALEVAAEFRARHKTVVVGGPHVSLAPEIFEGNLFDSLVIGELESVREEFFADMRAGALKPRYVAGKADMSTSPLPRWDLYPNGRALVGVVQTSRGCPYSCEFCDVIQYLGRKQRHKSNAQVLAEVQQLYDLGYSVIYLVDDNFSAYRKRAKSLLTVLRDWNGTQGRNYVRFLTQVSIDIARDEELLQLCADAGMLSLFMGIESVNKESMREVNKHQNVSVDLAAQIDKIVRRGLLVEAGLMLGFDHDGLDIFERQHAFAASLPVANFRISLLTAPLATPLYARIQKAGRIVNDDASVDYSSIFLSTNMQPAQMSRAQLLLGAKWLVSRLMHPQAFAERLTRIAEIMAPHPHASRGSGRMHHRTPVGLVDKAIGTTLRALAREDAAAGQTIRDMLDLSRRRPDIREAITNSVAEYAMRLRNFRHKGVYRDDLAAMPAPPFEELDAHTGHLS